MKLSEAELESLTQDLDIKLSYFDQLDSTNNWLMTQPPLPKPHLCVTPQQTAGRGRRGRSWLTERHKSICLSLRLPMSSSINELQGFSLATALAIKEAISPAIKQPINLKWPNDVLIDDNKLGGILIETASESVKNIDVVIGVGINIEPIHVFDKTTTSLIEAGWNPEQLNQCVTDMCQSLINTSRLFDTVGFNGFVDNWQAQDTWYGRQVSIDSGLEKISGIYEGVDEAGRLVLRNGEMIATYIAGEVSLR